MSECPERICVLHYSSVWLPQTEVWLYDQITHLPKSVESHVLCEQKSHLEQFAIPNLHCLADEPRLRRYWDKSLRKLRARSYIGYLSALAHQVKPRIIHSHFGNVAWANHKAVKAIGARHVATFYGLDVNYLPMLDYRWRERYHELFSSVDRVLCEGPHMARCLVELGCPEEKVRVHHLGVRVDDIPYRPRDWQPGTPLRVLIAATFREKKGIPYALDALGAIRNDVSLEVTVIGNATAERRSLAEKDRIMETVVRSGLSSQTRFLGFETFDGLMREAYKHHIFLSPSLTASDGDTEGGAPVGILHMAASGMPVVSTNHCDIPNVLPASAELVKERDVNGLIAELLRLVNTAGHWDGQLAVARKHVEENFNANTQGARLGAIYASIEA